MDNANHAQFIPLTLMEDVNANKTLFGMVHIGAATHKAPFVHLEVPGIRKN